MTTPSKSKKKSNRKDKKMATVIFDMYNFQLRKQMPHPLPATALVNILSYKEQIRFHKEKEAHDKDPKENQAPRIPEPWIVPFIRVDSAPYPLYYPETDIDVIISEQDTIKEHISNLGKKKEEGSSPQDETTKPKDTKPKTGEETT